MNKEKRGDNKQRRYRVELVRTHDTHHAKGQQDDAQQTALVHANYVIKHDA